MNEMLILENDQGFAKFIANSVGGIVPVFCASLHDALRVFCKRHRVDVIVANIELLDPLSKSIAQIRAHAPNAALVGVTSATHSIPGGFDAVSYKVQLTDSASVASLIYSAIRKRAAMSEVERNVQSVEMCALLMKPQRA